MMKIPAWKHPLDWKQNEKLKSNIYMMRGHTREKLCPVPKKESHSLRNLIMQSMRENSSNFGEMKDEMGTVKADTRKPEDWLQKQSRSQTEQTTE